MNLINSLEILSETLQENSELEPVADEKVEWHIVEDKKVLPFKASTFTEISDALQLIPPSLQSVLYIRFRPGRNVDDYFVYFRILESALTHSQAQFTTEIDSITIFPHRPSLSQIANEAQTLCDDVQAYRQSTDKFTDWDGPLCSTKKTSDFVTLSIHTDYLSELIFETEFGEVHPDTYTVWQWFNTVSQEGNYLTLWFYPQESVLENSKRKQVEPAFNTSTQQMEVYPLFDYACPDCEKTDSMQVLFTNQYEVREKVTLFCIDCFTAYSCSTELLSEKLENTFSLHDLQQTLATHIKEHSEASKITVSELKSRIDTNTENPLYPEQSLSIKLSLTHPRKDITAILNNPNTFENPDESNTMRVRFGDISIDKIPISITEELYKEIKITEESASCLLCSKNLTEGDEEFGPIRYSFKYYIHSNDSYSEGYQFGGSDSGAGDPHICRDCAESTIKPLGDELMKKYSAQIVSWEI